MEYQEKINLLDNSSNQQTRCKTKNWVDINAESRGPRTKIIKLELQLQC